MVVYKLVLSWKIIFWKTLMSPSQPEQRLLAALIFTDIVGYSAMTHRDEMLAPGPLDPITVWRDGISMINSAQNSFLFLPGITGVTQLVNETEINHSHYIIAELLEILIQSNRLNFRSPKSRVMPFYFTYWIRFPRLMNWPGGLRCKWLNFSENGLTSRMRRIAS